MAEPAFDWEEFRRVAPPPGARRPEVTAAAAPAPEAAAPAPAAAAPDGAFDWNEFRRVAPPPRVADPGPAPTSTPAPAPAPAAGAPAPTASAPAPAPAAEPERPGLGRRVWNYVSGNDRTEFPDMPELTSAPGLSAAGLRTAGGYMLTREPAQLQEVIQRSYPGATFSKDRFGNDIVAMPAQGDTPATRYYVNKPGASAADVMGAAAPALEGLAAARGGRGGASLGGRVTRASLAGGAASIGIDGAAAGLGGTPGLEGMATNAGIAAASGAAGEVALAAISAARGVLNRWGVTSARLLDETGAPNATGQRVLQQSGIDLSQMSADQIRGILRSAQEVGGTIEARGTAAARAAAGERTGEFGIPRTVGQRTGSREQLDTEDLLRNNGLPGGQPLRDFDQLQRRAADEAGARLQRSLGGNPDLPRTQADVGTVLGDNLRSLREARRQTDRAAYQQVGDLGVDNGGRGGAQVVFAREAAPDLGRRLDDLATRQTINPHATPAADANMTALRGTIESGEINLGRFESLRQRVLADQRLSTNPADREALGRIAGSMDNWLETAMERGQFRGQPDAVEALRAARASRRETAQLFTPENVHDMVPRVIDAAIEKSETGLDLYRRLFGQNASPSGAAVAVEHLGTMFGRESPVMSALREGRVDWMLRSAGDNGKAPTYEMVAQRITAATSPRGSEYAVTRALFNDEEIAQLSRFGTVMRDLADGTAKRNPSGTAYTISNIFQRFVGWGAGAAVGGAVGGPGGSVAGGMAGNAAKEGLAALSQGAAARAATQQTDGLAARPVSDLIRGSVAVGSQATGLAPAGLTALGNRAMDTIEPDRRERR